MGTRYVKKAWYVEKSLWVKPNSCKNMEEYVIEKNMSIVQKFVNICSPVDYEVVSVIMFSRLPQVYSLPIIMVLENSGVK
jgi:hypothetical protein